MRSVWEFTVISRARIALVTTVGAGLLAGSGLVGVSSGAPAAPAAHEGSTISIRHTSDGKVLVGANGHSLYTFSSDTRNHSNCGPACRKAWPPVTTSGGKPKAGTGVSAKHLGVIKGHQVTYYGHLLYYFKGDSEIGRAHV